MSKLICFIVAAKYCDDDLESTLLTIFEDPEIRGIVEVVIVLSSDQEVQELTNRVSRMHAVDNVSLIASTNSTGPYGAYNLGLSLASADYVSFIGAGEKIILSGLQWLVEVSKAIPFDFLHMALHVDGASSYVPNLICLGVPPHQACVFRRAVAIDNDIKYDERLKVYADGYFTAGFLRHCRSYLTTDKALVDYKSGGLGSGRSLRLVTARVVDLWRAFMLRDLTVGGFSTFLVGTYRQVFLLFVNQ